MSDVTMRDGDATYQVGRGSGARTPQDQIMTVRAARKSKQITLPDAAKHVSQASDATVAPCAGHAARQREGRAAYRSNGTIPIGGVLSSHLSHRDCLVTLDLSYVDLMKRTFIALAAALTLTLAGCAGTSGEQDSEPPAGTNSSEENEAEPAVDEEEPEAEPVDPGTLAFGDAFTYEDGLTVTVGKPSSFKPSEYAFTEEAPAYVAFEVTVVNKTGAPFDPGMISSSMQSGNTEAEEVFDSENGFSGSPDTKILDGRESKFKIGYGVSDPKDLVLELSPSWEHESIIYTS